MTQRTEAPCQDPVFNTSISAQSDDTHSSRRALLAQPKLLLLDEPTEGLAPVNAPVDRADPQRADQHPPERAESHRVAHAFRFSGESRIARAAAPTSYR